MDVKKDTEERQTHPESWDSYDKWSDPDPLSRVCLESLETALMERASAAGLSMGGSDSLASLPNGYGKGTRGTVKYLYDVLVGLVRTGAFAKYDPEAKDVRGIDTETGTEYEKFIRRARAWPEKLDMGYIVEKCPDIVNVPYRGQPVYTGESSKFFAAFRKALRMMRYTFMGSASDIDSSTVVESCSASASTNTGDIPYELDDMSEMLKVMEPMVVDRFAEAWKSAAAANISSLSGLGDDSDVNDLPGGFHPAENGADTVMYSTVFVVRGDDADDADDVELQVVATHVRRLVTYPSPIGNKPEIVVARAVYELHDPDKPLPNYDDTLVGSRGFSWSTDAFASDAANNMASILNAFSEPNMSGPYAGLTLPSKIEPGAFCYKRTGFRALTTYLMDWNPVFKFKSE